MPVIVKECKGSAFVAKRQIRNCENTELYCKNDSVIFKHIFM